MNYTWPNYSRCFFPNHCHYFLLRYSHVRICATCASSGTWQGHMCHFMDIDKTWSEFIKYLIYNYRKIFKVISEKYQQQLIAGRSIYYSALTFRLFKYFWTVRVYIYVVGKIEFQSKLSIILEQAKLSNTDIKC